MSGKQTGYNFWNNVLGSPLYIAAPMVDMSELAYRVLCRRHGAQLCYSPMLHSQQFSQDFLYRQDNFSTCSEDRPLIVQFCANDPDTFVTASSLVSHACDAVDLNLGCPQAIARKGYYGSFLQDDWDIIRSIVQKAAHELPIPVTCKMRILPGHFKKSIEYAKMLEHAGCSVLTVHGRTREQKGQATGLASWDVIKEIKANVNIPVIANGNILSFDDVQDCLQFTGVDAVMSAEALLHNPALFSGKTPPVWKMVEEYLEIAEKYNTPIRCVRCHLFKILYLCIYQDAEVKQILTDGSTFAEFYSVIDILKKMPDRLSCSNANTLNEEDQDYDNFLNSLSLNFYETVDSIEFQKFQTDFTDPKELECLTEGMKACNLFSDSNANISELISKNNESKLQDASFQDEYYASKNLPIWICHSRPRITDNDKDRGCFSKYFDFAKENSTDEQFISKKKLRRARHHERVIACMKEKRKLKKMRRKQKIAESVQNQEPRTEEVKEKKNNLTKKQKKMLIRDRLLNAQGSAPKICINLGFASLMNTKELTRLSSQLRRLYGSNRHSDTPLHLFFCNFRSSDELYKICESKNDGFTSYVVEMTSKAPEELFDLENIIYLSPDSEDILETLDDTKIYVIGGIVDGTVRKDLSLNHAKYRNVQTARLPIPEHLVPFSSNPGTTVLTVNQVFDILLKYYETRNWTESLSANVPLRKGYCDPSKKIELQNGATVKEFNDLSIDDNLENISTACS